MVCYALSYNLVFFVLMEMHSVALICHHKTEYEIMVVD